MFPKANLVAFFLLATCWLTGQPYDEVVMITNLESINTKYLEYAPVWWNNQLVFTSNRPRSGHPIANWHNPEDGFTDLYLANQMHVSSFYYPALLSDVINCAYHDGTAAFSKTGEQQIFFTRSNHNGINDQQTVNLKIYTARLIDGQWQDLQELPFQDDHAIYAHPTVTPDGHTLYFTSNRSGGFGGMDLYRMERINGQWQPPVNLGEPINSTDNDAFPHLDHEGNLFFASNRRGGYGGLDIWRATLPADNPRQLPVNLGLPFNSPADDFGLITLPGQNEGYFSSSRPGGKGGDDLYYWKKERVLPPASKVVVQAVNSMTGEALKDALITIIAGTLETADLSQPLATMVHYTANPEMVPYLKLPRNSYRTGITGTVSFLPKTDQDYTIFIERKGYAAFKKVIKSEDIIANKWLLLKVNPNSGIPLVLKAMEIPGYRPAELVNLELLNHCTGVTQRAITDENGNHTFYLNCDCDYQITAEKANLRHYRKKVSTKGRICGDLQPITEDLYLVDQQSIGQFPQRQ